MQEHVSIVKEDKMQDWDREASRYATVFQMIKFAEQRGEPELAQACAASAVEQGILKNTMQRPALLYRSLRSIPVFDPAEFWIVSHLEKHHEEIKAETDHLETGQTQGFEADFENLVTEGAWDKMVLFRNGQRVEETCRMFPRTTEILEQVPKEILSCGFVKFSLLQPGSYIRPHCGPSNHPLRLQLAIRTSKDAQIRVADQLMHWTEGRCLVFDHSFEHEVWNRGDHSRLVLIFEIPHPDMMKQDEKQFDLQSVGLMKSLLECHFAHRGINSVRRDVDDKLDLEYAAGLDSEVLRLMKQFDLGRITRTNDGQLQLFR